MQVVGLDYKPDRFILKAGMPVEWRTDAREAEGCRRVLVRSLPPQRSAGILLAAIPWRVSLLPSRFWSLPAHARSALRRRLQAWPAPVGARGVIAISDKVKANAADAIRQLHAPGLRTVMITGDNARAAKAIALQLGLDDIRAEVLPQDKARTVCDFQERGARVAFVGDNINNAPALARADLGITIGTGTDIAIEAGHILLVKGSPLKVVEALALSRVAFRTIRQNMFGAVFFDIAAIRLAALGISNSTIAVAAMAFSSVTVISNSLRIKRRLSWAT